ncbi:hypothetical protein OEZ86_009120 [Tetradesmus obliquus]|nr:hypothetical protein OEZ86_009120 [Tetradesmus obliquus]
MRLAKCWRCLAVLLLVQSLCLQLCSGQSSNQAVVTSVEQFKAALLNPAVGNIVIMRSMALPHDFGTVPISRQLLITSPIRSVIDWCDDVCNAAKTPIKPYIVLLGGAQVTFNRVFFRNLVPHSNASQSSSPTLDYTHSPVPFVVSSGGQVTYNLVVIHWLPSMFWVFENPANYWAKAAVSAIVETRHKQPLQFQTPDLYSVKSFTTDGTATVADCYMPFDVDSCLTNQPFTTTLIYCPYTFKDSLKNPYVTRVLVFHDIGLDRLVNSYRNPVSVNRTVEYVSCPGTRHVMDLDNVTNSVVITQGGSLNFRNMIFQGTKNQNKTTWPSSIPLLLSTFNPIRGTVALRDSTVRIRNMDRLIVSLTALPSGSNSVVEVPNLQPTYVGPPPKMGDSNFTVSMWQLQQQRYLTLRQGGQQLMEKINDGMASWQFFNVSVEKYVPEDCFGGAYTQGSVGTPESYSVVSSGQQLIEQLGNSSARYIKVVSDITIPASMPKGAVSVERIVEVRGCHPGGRYTIDWSRLSDVVSVKGTAYFQGDMLLTGIGWSGDAAQQQQQPGNSQVVEALQPVGGGTVDYEDLTLLAEMPAEPWGNASGQGLVSSLMAADNLDSQPLNMSLIDNSVLLLRGYYVNRSDASNGQFGVESFQDVFLKWREAAPAARSSGVPVAAIVVPIIAALALAGLIAGLLVMRRRRRSAAAAAAAAGGKAGGLPHVFADASRYSQDELSGVNSTDTGPGSGGVGGALVVRAGADQLRSHSNTSSSLSKAKSGPSQDIALACKNLVLHRTANEPDELVLQSVLGEGSYGKVFKATWKGTVVAVKIMVLPSYMSGKEKREKMAVMETAISSSLSHPNVVQTYTYAVEPVRSNAMSDRHSSQGPGASISMHDSTHSVLKAQRQPGDAAAAEDGSEAAGNGNGAAFSWEVRLVQEFCDLGSLRDALKGGKQFRDGDGALKLGVMIDTALDVARAMAHLHGHNIIHSDLKARNVLLRSDMHDERGFTAKVADFGLSLTIDPHSTHVSNAFQGTMTHMAPETLMSGQISRASDVYAYGIMLWELYTGDHAYRGIPRALLGHNITKAGMRPTFPSDTPFDWQFLACRCWETDAAIRPSFEQIMQELKRMKQKLAAAGGSSSSGASSSSPPSSSLLLLQQQQQPAHAALNMPQILQQLHGAPRQAQLPCIEDSDTLPTEVDRALWDEQHQQTLQQQELQRQVSRSFPCSNGAAAAAAAPAAGGGVGYTGASAAIAGALSRRDSELSRQASSTAGGPTRTISGQQLLLQMQQMQMQQETGGSSIYVDGSHMLESGDQQRVYNTNVHSTMCDD